MASPYDWLGYLAGLLFIVSLVPQVLKSWKSKSTQGMPMGRAVLYVAAMAAYVAYAYFTANEPLLWPGVIELALGITLLGLKLKYG